MGKDMDPLRESTSNVTVWDIAQFHSGGSLDPIPALGAGGLSR
jgi:hypothetical protein